MPPTLGTTRRDGSLDCRLFCDVIRTRRDGEYGARYYVRQAQTKLLAPKSPEDARYWRNSLADAENEVAFCNCLLEQEEKINRWIAFPEKGIDPSVDYWGQFKALLSHLGLELDRFKIVGLATAGENVLIPTQTLANLSRLRHRAWLGVDNRWRTCTLNFSGERFKTLS